MRRHGSYAEGFAPRDFEPRYPELWEGCVGAWAMNLGPTGDTIKDWSGRGQHSALTNMAPGSDWIISGGHYALDFDGTNDRADGGTLAPVVASTQVFTLSFWVYDNSAATNTVFIGFGNSGNSNPLIYLQKVTNGIAFGSTTWRNTAGVAGAFLADINSVFAGISNTAGLWTHVFITCDGLKIRGYFNGIWANTIDRTVPPAAPIDLNLLTFGALGRTTYTSFSSCYLDDIRVYDRPLPIQLGQLLAKRRGIAYEWDDKTRYVEFVQAPIITTVDPVVLTFTPVVPATTKTSTVAPAALTFTPVAPTTKKITTVAPVVLTFTPVAPNPQILTTVAPVALTFTPVLPSTQKNTTVAPQVLTFTPVVPIATKITTVDPQVITFTPIAPNPATTTTVSPVVITFTPTTPTTIVGGVPTIPGAEYRMSSRRLHYRMTEE